MNTLRSRSAILVRSRFVTVLALLSTAFVVASFIAPAASAAGGETYAVTDIGDLSQTTCFNPKDFVPPGAAATALNDAGQVVGWVHYFCGDGSFWGFRWDNGALTTLNLTPDGYNSEALAINDAGVAVGWSTLQSYGGQTAVEWNGSSATDIGTLAYGGPCPQPFFSSCANFSVRSFATNINAQGEVVGLSSATPNSAATTAFLYENGTLLNNADGLLGGPQRTIGTNVWGQSVSGATVGTCVCAGPVVTGGDPTVTRDGVVTHLNDVIAPGSGLTLVDAADINDRGQIVGTAATTDCAPAYGCLTGMPHPYLLTDETPPSCVQTGSGTNTHGQSYVIFTVQDTLSGLKDLTTSQLTNMTLDTPQWNVGTPRAVVVTATQVSPSNGGRVALQATDIGGNTIECSATAPIVSPPVTGHHNHHLHGN
jgi:probable HAF family extracellular repeat protein